MWWIQASEIAGPNGERTGRWRMTATSDEGGGGPFGDETHDHDTAHEAAMCDKCDEYCSRIAGFPSRREREIREKQRELRLRNETLVRLMVDRFLRWKLPADFAPDCYITFDREAAERNKHHWPVGTNLLTAPQAEVMIRHLLGLLPE